MIKEFAEKIYGFAYSKTHNSTDAADLSQEILLNLYTTDLSEVGNMNAFVHTVCRYTWSKFLSKNKREWDSVTLSGEVGDYFDFRDDCTPEQLVIERETYDKIRREVMYLSGIRRDIIIMKYYDRMNASEIGEKLGLNPSTVRWHLSKIKTDLKERFEMKDEIYRAQKLSVGHWGWYKNQVYTALSSDILMQNICIVCRQSPKTIEEISRIIGVAAVYLEDKISSLCSMDYMIAENGRYRTNFFIRDADFQIAHAKYEFEHVSEIANIYFDSVKPVLHELRKIGFVGHALDENQLMWDFLAYFMMREIGRIDEQMIKDLGLDHSAPMRPDGSKHWVRAYVPDGVVLASEKFPPYLRDFYENAMTFGISCDSNETGRVRSYKYSCLGIGGIDGFMSCNTAIWEKTASLERTGTQIDALDREQFSSLAEKGFIEIKNGKCRMNFPYLTYSERIRADELFDGCVSETDRKKIYTLFTGYAKYIDRFIPTYITSNERAHYKTSYDPHVAILWYLLREGKLLKPSINDAACAIVFEESEA